MTTLTDAFVWVIMSSIWTNRTRCTLYKKILALLDEESISGESNGSAPCHPDKKEDMFCFIPMGLACPYIVHSDIQNVPV